jgi:hypothetical protein
LADKDARLWAWFGVVHASCRIRPIPVHLLKSGCDQQACGASSSESVRWSSSGMGGEPMNRWAGVVVVGLAGLVSTGGVIAAGGEGVSIQVNELSWQDAVFFGDYTKSLGAKLGDIAAETKYHLTVNGGSGDGDYAIGQQIQIIAGEAPPGKYFVSWRGDWQYLEDANSGTTTVIMPCKNVTVTANYEEFSNLSDCCASSAPVLPLMGFGWFCLTRSRRRP